MGTQHQLEDHHDHHHNGENGDGDGQFGIHHHLYHSCHPEHHHYGPHPHQHHTSSDVHKHSYANPLPGQLWLQLLATSNG